MTPWERLGVLAGAQWVPTAPYPRHDILAADLSLRVAELSPVVGAVYGEKLSDAWRLTGLPPTVTRHACGDAVWVRSDGLRIVVELSIAAPQSGYRKAERWARILEADEKRSLFVLFVVGVHPESKSYSLTWSKNTHRKAVEDAAWSGIEAAAARVPERMGVVSLADWFPGQMRASRDFQRLNVWRPTGPRGERFDQADLADPAQVELGDSLPPDEALAPIENAELVYATPWWLLKRRR